MRLTRKDFELEITPMQETLDQVETTLRAHYEIKDWMGIHLILAIAAAHYLPGEMLWIVIIGPPRSGKTELLQAIATHNPDCEYMEAMTPAALRGGLKNGPKVLTRINGKLVITKDFAALLTTRPDTKNEILGLLRGIKDGSFTSDFGSPEGHLQQEAKFDWIAASTPFIEQQRNLEGLLGERFIDLRWIPGDREEMAYRAANNNPFMQDIRAELSVDVASLMTRAREEATTGGYGLSECELRVIAKIADTVALARSPIQENKAGHIISIPDPELGTDIAQGFVRVVAGLQLVGIEDYLPYIHRLAWDCLPSIRSKILKSLIQAPKTVPELAKAIGLPERTVYYHVGHLKLLKVARESNGVIESTIQIG